MPTLIRIILELVFIAILWFVASLRPTRPTYTKSVSPPSPLRFVNGPRRRGGGESPGCTPTLPRITVSSATTPVFELKQEEQRERNYTLSQPSPRNHVAFTADPLSTPSLHDMPGTLLATNQKQTTRPATPFVWGVLEDEFDEDDIATSRMPSRVGSPMEAVTQIKM